jgi:uncharacterized protein YdhG (YjbR/CyaY superfamily)
MANKTRKVDAYLESLTSERRTALAQLRSLVFKVAPGAEETMKYKMPTYEYGGETLCAFASQKHYMSVYLDTELVEKHRAELEGLSVGKSCVRFKRMEQLPLDTIRMILTETLGGKRSE